MLTPEMKESLELLKAKMKSMTDEELMELEFDEKEFLHLLEAEAERRKLSRPPG